MNYAKIIVEQSTRAARDNRDDINGRAAARRSVDALVTGNGAGPTAESRNTLAAVLNLGLD